MSAKTLRAILIIVGIFLGIGGTKLLTKSEPPAPINITPINPNSFKEYIDRINEWKGKADEYQNQFKYLEGLPSETAYVSLPDVDTAWERQIAELKEKAKTDSTKIEELIKAVKAKEQRQWTYDLTPKNSQYFKIVGIVYPATKTLTGLALWEREPYFDKDRFYLSLNLPIFQSPSVALDWNIKTNKWIGMGVSPKVEEENLKARFHLRAGLTF